MRQGEISGHSDDDKSGLFGTVPTKAGKARVGAERGVGGWSVCAAS